MSTPGPLRADGLHLTKAHGTGNDFLVLVDPDDTYPLEPAVVAALCDRWTGIGADGVIRVVAADVEGTPGWEPHPDLKVDPHHQVFKGRDRETDGYTGWSPELADFLARRGTTRVVVVGLALDYCVQATALDARAAGHEVLVLTDATRAVNVNPDDGERALDALRAAGVREDRAEG